MDEQGIALSRRRITLSTSGVVPMIPRVGAELDVNLAVSLHAVSDEVRDVLVPINRKWPIAELLEACADYPGAKNSRRITFEYVMLKGVNDSDADARELVRLLEPAPRQGQPDPVQPVAGRALRVQLQQPHPPLRRDRQRRRAQRAGAHAARPRHPRRLRPAQERKQRGRGTRASATSRPRPGFDLFQSPADSISQLLHEPEPRMARRIVFDAAEFGVAVAAVEVGCLKTDGVETNSDATARPGDLFGLRQQA